MTPRAQVDGKQLEELVATIEGLFLPHGFDVKKNTRVYNDHGVLAAEFDVEIRGKLGSANMAWLIECRNRPSEGPAPGAWIEQLVGRRSRFNFDKVMAVSTTGFAAGAVTYAQQVGIDLRSLDEVGPDMASWLRLRSLQSQGTWYRLAYANLIFAQHETDDRAQALRAVLARCGEKPLDGAILRSTKTGEWSSSSAIQLSPSQIRTCGFPAYGSSRR